MKKLILVTMVLLIATFAFADVIIGTGTLTQRFPFGHLWGYERSAALYPATDIGATGLITELKWNVQSVGSVNVPIKIYLTTTTQTALTVTDWSSITAGLTPVYQGTRIFNTLGWTTFDITDFNYQGGSLLVLVETNYGGTGTSNYPNIYYTTATAQHQQWTADNNPPTGNGTVNANRPNITLVGITPTNPPVATTPVSPANNAIGVTETATLNWNIVNGAASYKLYFGTNNPPTNLVNGTNLGNVQTYDPPGNMQYNTQYYWQVIPTNQYGDATGCPVWSFTTRSDPFVYTLPYNEGFETENTHNTAIQGWDQAAVTGTNVWTANNSLTDYNRAPRTGSWNAFLRYGNTRWMFKGIQLQGGTAYKVVVFARQDGASATDASIGISYGNAPTAAGMTNTILAPTGIINGDYQRLEGIFSPATTGGYYIGILGTISSSPWYISIDDISVLEISPNPQLGYTPTALNFGSVMQGVQSAPLNVNVTNAGGGTLNLAAANISIIGANASQFGFSAANLPAALTAGQSVAIPVSVTASTQGPISATLRIVHNAHNYDVALTATGLPAGLVIIGNGTTNQMLPVNAFYGYTYSQTIYMQSEINTANRRIEKIAYYWNGAGVGTNSNEWIVYMGHTNQSTYTSTSGWIPVSQMTQVYAGTLNIPAVAGWIEILLDNPFVYNNIDNLVIAVDENKPGYDGSSQFFFSTLTPGQGRSLRHYSDGVNCNPASPEQGEVISAHPNISITFGDLPTTPILSYQPSSINFGSVMHNTQMGPVNVTLSNTGSGTLNLAAGNISIIGSNATEFSFSAVNLPAALTPGTTVQIPVFVTATSEGAISATLRIVYNSQNYDVALSATGLQAGLVIIGDGTVTFRYPLGSYFGFERSAALYTAAEIGAGNRRISSLGWYATQAANDVVPTKIYLKTYAGNTLTANNWANLIAGASTVFDANITGVTANNWNIVTLANTFDLDSGSNLLVLVERNFGGSGGSSGSVAPAIRHSNVADRHLTIMADTNPPTGNGSIQSARPNLMFASSSYNISDPPNSAILISPANGAIMMELNTTLNWAAGGGAPTGYKLYLGTTNPPAFVADLGNVFSYAPQNLAAEHTYYWKIVPYNANGDAANCPVWSFSTIPAGLFTIGDGSQTARIPIDMFYKNSLHQYMIYPAEINNSIGMINGLALYNQFTSNLTNKPIKIWIGTTTLNDLNDGWIPVTGHTLVFDGNVDFPSGQNTITFTFNSPYLYLNGQNLVITVKRVMDTQYYSSTDNFKAQTGTPAARARNVYSDSVDYDPTDPGTVGTNSGQFAKTTLLMTIGGVGHINGTVTGTGGAALAGVNVQFATGGYHATTDAQGYYSIQNIVAGAYQISFGAHGYQTLTQNITITEDQTLTQNVQMQPLPMVSVNGTVLASDTGAGLPGASIFLTGYQNYTANTNASGAFSIPGVYANNSYAYVISAAGYTSQNGTINVAANNHNMGNITLAEVAYAPIGVTATTNPSNTSVNISWLAPDPNAVEITQSFENETFPPAQWTRTVTNNGAPNAQGVYPTWCRVGSVNNGGEYINPTQGNSQAGLFWDYSHQDEWLITPGFNCPPSAYLKFDSYVYLGSVNQDHYYVKVSNDNGNTWTVLWDASAQTGGWNHYASPITVDLSSYTGQQIKLAFHAVDGPDNSGLWYVWFIDKIYIGNTITLIRFDADQLVSRSYGDVHSAFGAQTPMRNASRAMEQGYSRTEPRLPFANEMRQQSNPPRVLTGYKVWRFQAGQETNENAWTLITPEMVTSLDVNDPDWAALPNGQYRWAVKAIYTAGVSSVAALSNVLLKEVQSGMIAGVVRRASGNTPIMGATILVAGLTATTNAAGAYTIIVPVGIHDVTASATGFITQTITGVTVNINQTTTQNFLMVAGSANEDEYVPVTATELRSNYPNPFNPSTTIAYSIKEAGAVRLDIFNIKGQLVSTLVNAEQASGHYKVTWNGKDTSGKACASGVYYYRLSAPGFKHTRKMVLSQ